MKPTMTGLPSSWTHAAGAFGSAVGAMATSAEPLRKRLELAHLIFGVLTQEDLPAHLRPRFRELRNRLTACRPTGEEGSVSATLARMRTKKLTAIARMIVELSDDLAAQTTYPRAPAP